MNSSPCPDCAAPLTGAPTCAWCGLQLMGPTAARLWQVDLRLAQLAGERAELLAEREGLPTALRAGAGTSSVGFPGLAGIPGAAADPRWKSGLSTAGGPAQGRPVPGPAEWTTQRVQNLLLGLGGLLLALAGIVFTAVTYDHLGVLGRAAVLLTLTLGAGLAVPRLVRRALSATAETVAGFALVLGGLDAYGLRTLGLAEGVDPLSYAAGSALALAGICGLYAWRVAVRLPRFATVVRCRGPYPPVRFLPSRSLRWGSGRRRRPARPGSPPEPSSLPAAPLAACPLSRLVAC